VAWDQNWSDSGIPDDDCLSIYQREIAPGDVSASQRYWDEDIINPEVQVTPQGSIRVPQTPGLGYQIRERRIEELTVKRESYSSRFVEVF